MNPGSTVDFTGNVTAALTPGVVAAGVLALVCLLLWLLEKTPAFVPTLLLVAGAPVLLSSRGLDLGDTLAAAAHPVMALFFGGFVLAAAAHRHGLDRVLVGAVVRATGGSRRALVAGLAVTAAFASMWMSNIAAAALLLQVVRPLVDDEPPGSPFRRAALLAVAFGANLGGIATPIGTGPNAIAIAASSTPISFARWMSFGVPLVLALLALAVLLIFLTAPVSGTFTTPTTPPTSAPTPASTTALMTLAPSPARLDGAGWAVVAIFVACIAGWLTEPLHGIDAAIIAIAAAALLFASGLLGKEELGKLDWSTLFLIAGGLVLGRVLEAMGLLEAFKSMASARPGVAVIVVGAAVLSSLMSNTATAVLVMPLALSLDASPAMAVLVAVGCSLGAPFVISTPPNAMVAGAGVKSRDLLLVGLPLMGVGVAIVVVTGPAALAFFGLGAAP